MAQIIQLRRGTLSELNSVTLRNGELGVVSSSVAAIGDSVLKTAVVVGNSDGTNRLSIGRLVQGSGSATLAGITGGAALNDMLYYDTNDYKLQTLHTTNGVTTLNLTGNISATEIAGNISGSSTSTGSFGYLNVAGDGVIGGNLTFGDANTDNVSFGADVSSSLIPNNDDAFDLGSSGQQWKDLYIDGVAYIDTIGSDGDPTTSAYIAGGEIDATVIGSETPAAITGTTIDATTDFTIGTTVITDDSIVMTPTPDDTATIEASTNGALAITTVDTAAAAANITITADGTFEAIGTTVTLDSGGNIALEPAGGSHIKLDDVIQVDSGVVTGATSITSTAFVGTLDGAVGGNTPAAGVFTTVSASGVITAQTGIIPDATDGAYLGTTGAQWSDLFLAEGGVINWDNGDATLTQASDVVTLAGATLTGTLTNALSVTANGGIGMTSYNASAAVANLALDIDGMTDIGAAPASGDLIIIDDGAGGTNRKSTIDRVATKFAGTGLSAASAVISIDAADTTTTSIINASLGKIGTNASQEYVTFGTANQVNTFIDDSEVLSVTSAGIEVTGNTIISGNLTVNGTQTTISSSIVDIGDNIIQVNGTPVTYGGLHVKDVTSTETGSMVWNTTSNYWVAGLSGSEYRVPIQNTTSALTDNKVVIAQGNGRIESSGIITDDGSTVDFSDVDLTSIDKLEGVDANTYVDIGDSGLIVTKGTIQPYTTGGNDLGATGIRYANLWLSGNADLEGDIDVNGTANLDVTDIDGTLDVAGVSDFQSRVDAQASLVVTGSVYATAGASVAASSASLVSFRNDSNDQLGYLASANTSAVTTGLVGYNASTGNLTISSVIDGGTF